jgi:aminobenzoyl-glutamate utilization protein B
MAHVAKIMAGTAVDALRDATLIARAKADFRERTQRQPHVCPLPEDLTPPIRPRAKAA